MDKEYIPNKYNRFLTSEWWQAIRNRRFALSGKKCERCSCKNNLQVHHSDYCNLYAGRINKAAKHTHVLCRDCHSEFHQRYQTKRNMRVQTNKFIREYQIQIRRAEKQAIKYEEEFNSIVSSF